MLAPFWHPKSTSEGLGREKVDLQKPYVFVRTTILFKLGGRPGAPKLAPGSPSKRNPNFYRIRTNNESKIKINMLEF